MEIKTIDIDSIKQLVLKTSNNELYIPLHGKHTTNPEEEPFDLAQKIQSFFEFNDASTSDPKVMLLMGDTGSGKSVFSQQLYQQLWKSYQSGDSIPLWIPLPELDNPFESAVEEVLKKHGMDDSQISELKVKEKFIFIVDGYDELHQFQNCYVTNKWEKWNAKCLITCRLQALYYQKDPDKYFMPFKGDKRLPLLLRRLYVAPFSKEQISAYVKKYQQLNSEHKISEEDFSKVPGLTELINTPFLLHLAVEALPDILAGQEAEEENPKMTQAKLYDVFIELWFTRQVKKLSVAGLLKDTEQNTKRQFWDYCKKLAQKMHEKEVSFIPYQGQKIGGRLFGKQEQTNIWESFFNEETEILRSACPLKRMGDHNYGFVHASMVEYFATRAMYEEIQQTESEEIQDVVEDEGEVRENEKSVSQQESIQLRGGIHQRVFAMEKRGIQFLADRIEMSKEFKQKMLVLLEASKKSKRFAIGAANAITALIRAGVTFNGANLSEIKISGADISGGFFDRADLSEADLSNTEVHHTWLREANLEGSQLAGVNFGEYPWYDEVGCFDYREDLQRFVATRGKEILLFDTLTGDILLRFKGHKKNVDCVQFSSDGKRMVSGSYDQTVRIWDIASGKIISVFKHESGTDGVAIPVAFSSDGTLIGSCEYVRKINIWETASRNVVAVLEGHKSGVYCFAFSPNSQFVVTGGGATVGGNSGDYSVRVWEVPSGKELKVLLGHESRVNSVAFSPDSERVVSGAKDIRVWDVLGGNVATIVLKVENEIKSVAFSQDSKWVVSGGADGAVRIWDLASKKELAVLWGHIGSVNQVQLVAGNRRVISGGEYRLREWDIDEHLLRFRGHQSRVQCLAFSGDGEWVVSGSGDKKTRIWDVMTGNTINVLDSESFFRVAFSPDRKYVATSYGTTVIIWEVATNNLQRYFGHENTVLSVVFSSDGKRIMSKSGSGKEARIWNIGNSEAIAILEGFTPNVVLSLTGEWAAAINNRIDSSYKLFPILSIIELASGKEMNIPLKGTVNCVAFSPEGTHLVTGGGGVVEGMAVRIWEVATGKEIAVLNGHKKVVNCVAYSPNGKRVVSGSDDKTMRVWDVESQKVLTVLRAHSHGVLYVQFSPDGELIISQSYSQVRETRVSQVESGKIVGVLEGHHNKLDPEQFCLYRGRLLLSDHNEDILRIWDIATAKCVSQLKFAFNIGNYSIHPNGTMVVGLENGSLECWHNLGDEGDYSWLLHWSTDIDSRALCVAGLRVQHVTGLSDQNHRMLMQRGADIKTHSAPTLHSQVAKRTGSPIHQNINNNHSNEPENNNAENEGKTRHCVIA